jgi:hypothetical protein
MKDDYSLLQEDLSEFEKECVPVIINGLKNKIGKDNAVNNSYIISKMDEIGFSGLRPPRVRKIVNHIRNNDLLLLLCANSKGYFLPKNLEELDGYFEVMEKRINSQIKTFDKLKSQRELYLNSMKK